MEGDCVEGRGSVPAVRSAATVARNAVTVVRSGVMVVRSAVAVVRSAVAVARSAATVVRSAVTVVRSAVTVVRSAVTVARGAVTVARNAMTVARSGVRVVRAGFTVVRDAVTVARYGVTFGEPAPGRPRDRGLRWRADCRGGRFLLLPAGGPMPSARGPCERRIPGCGGGPPGRPRPGGGSFPWARVWSWWRAIRGRPTSLRTANGPRSSTPSSSRCPKGSGWTWHGILELGLISTLSASLALPRHRHPDGSPGDLKDLAGRQLPSPRSFPLARLALRMTELGGWRSDKVELCEQLCEQSVREASRNIKRAAGLARLAQEIADHIHGPEGWRDKVRGFAMGHGANIPRLRGDLKEAKASFAGAKKLWCAGVDPLSILDPGRMLDLEAVLLKDRRKLPPTWPAACCASFFALATTRTSGLPTHEPGAHRPYGSNSQPAVG